MLCYCADSRGRNNRSGAAIAVPHRGSTHIVARSLWVAIAPCVLFQVVPTGVRRVLPVRSILQHRGNCRSGMQTRTLHTHADGVALPGEPDDRSVGSILLRIASVPASHVYVRHLSPPGWFNPVVRLDDPVPADGRTVPGGWWPPLMLEPGWVSDNHQRFDVFHVHFGFDAVGPEVLTEVVQELKSLTSRLCTRCTTCGTRIIPDLTHMQRSKTCCWLRHTP
jgi:hypothetical protein